MFVITADQVASRRSTDAVGAAVSELAGLRELSPVLPPERTVGDELQLVVATGAEALRVILLLTRTGIWSVGCGVGAVRTPLAPSARESSGEAFFAARTAVERAKGRPTRFALERDGGADAAGAEALVDLLLALRARRSPEGWEVHDELATGASQAEAARRLSVTPQAVSSRARTADLRLERAALGPLERLLDDLDPASDGRTERTSS